MNEGSAAGLTQAESEYKDFITFFPNSPEAAEAQMKIADIHYRQTGKPDRDFEHGKRAEEEYRQMLLQYPDSKLAEKARIRLLEVQEVLAEREYGIGRFYYMRESWPAAMARLKTLTDTYPLFSKADDALFMLGDAYERQIQAFRVAKFPKEKENARAELIRQYSDGAAAAYTRIITRYPVMPRAGDAAKRLAAMGRPVPKPTPEAIALNRSEQASRGKLGQTGKVMLSTRRRPDFAPATKVGQPQLDPPQQADAAQIVRSANEMVKPPKQATGVVSADTVKRADIATSPAPHSEEPAAAQSSDAPAPAPQQTNEANVPDPAASGTQPQTQSHSSSKPKKSGLWKLIPF
jgi:outer membrane protein assembly factor BamD